MNGARIGHAMLMSIFAFSESTESQRNCAQIEVELIATALEYIYNEISVRPKLEHAG